MRLQVYGQRIKKQVVYDGNEFERVKVRYWLRHGNDIKHINKGGISKIETLSGHPIIYLDDTAFKQMHKEIKECKKLNKDLDDKWNEIMNN